MFRSSIDAFLYLLDGREQKDNPQKIHDVESIQVDVDYLENRIKPCGVQVMFDDGAGYAVEAYDKEADGLYKEAKMRACTVKAPY